MTLQNFLHVGAHCAFSAQCANRFKTTYAEEILKEHIPERFFLTWYSSQAAQWTRNVLPHLADLAAPLGLLEMAPNFCIFSIVFEEAYCLRPCKRKGCAN